MPPIYRKFNPADAPIMTLAISSPSLPLVRALTRAAGHRRTRGVHYFTDAAPLASGGTPSVVFGPGDIAQAHTACEWLAIEQLESAVRILERFLRDLD